MAIFGQPHEIRRRRKRGRAKIPSPQPPSFLPARAEKFLSKFAVRIFVKKSSDFNQKAPPVRKMKSLARPALSPKRRGEPTDLKIK